MNTLSFVGAAASSSPVSTPPLAGVGARPLSPPGDAAAAPALRSAAPTAPPVRPGADELRSLVKEMQAKVNGATSALEFSVDQDSGKSIVKVTERTTKQVIWQFPSEQALQVTKELDRYQGALLSRKA